MFSKSRMEISEALDQLRDFTLMTAANLAYLHAETCKSREDCALMIADQIRQMMRVQK